MASGPGTHSKTEVSVSTEIPGFLPALLADRKKRSGSQQSDIWGVNGHELRRS